MTNLKIQNLVHLHLRRCLFICVSIDLLGHRSEALQSQTIAIFPGYDLTHHPFHGFDAFPAFSDDSLDILGRDDRCCAA